MALFNKLFSTHKRKNVSNTSSHQHAKQFPFSNEQVRILLYRECDWRGRRLLFDSTAIHKVNLADPPSAQQHVTPHIVTGTTKMPPINGNFESKKQSQANGFIDTVDGFGYKYMRQDETDFNDIGEMVFGSVAMSVRATTLKVHWLQDPTRILCSQVFVTPQPNTHASTSGPHLDSSPADLNSLDTSSLNSFSLSVSVCVSDNLSTLGNCDKPFTHPLDVPSISHIPSESSETGADRSLAYSDSGYSGTDPWTSCSSYCPYNSSTRSSFGSVYSDRGEAIRKFSTDSSIADITSAAQSDGSLQRRILRNVNTSFENRRSQNDCVGYVNEQGNQPYLAPSSVNGGSEGCVSRARRASEQNETHSNPEMFRKRGISSSAMAIHGSNRSGRRAKLGLAICITLSDTVEEEMQIFCSEHVILLESMLTRLRASAESAYSNQKKFYQLMLHAWFATREWFVDFFTAPRLIEPVWLALSGGYAADARQLSQTFMQELCWLLNCADTKDTNFFISTLLTAILTHHLGWVGTIAPLSGSPNDTHSSVTSNPYLTAQLARMERAKMSEISKYHPYNVLWAQMSDLYGAIGNPPKLSKTVVCGSQETLMDKVLNVLTYFIRCGQIERDVRKEVFEKHVIDDILDDFTKANKRATMSPLAEDTSSDLERSNSMRRSGKGMSRSSTCIKDLTMMESADEEPNPFLRKKNDIPNVLIFRDSRFVKQELRIGNHLMDTGIEMTRKQRAEIQNYRVKQSDTSNIRVLVTSPELEEFAVNDVESNSTDDTVEEATENYVASPEKYKPSLSDLITLNSMGGGGSSTCMFDVMSTVDSAPFTAGSLLWCVEPTKTASVEQWANAEQSTPELNLRNDHSYSDGNIESASTKDDGSSVDLSRSKSLYTKSSNSKNSDHIRRSKIYRKKSISDVESIDFDVDENTLDDMENVDPAPNSTLKAYPSLSDLITANSVGASDRLTWGIELVKETVTLDEIHHFETAQKRIDDNSRKDPGVVFVLGGDNEKLTNLKSMSPSKCEDISRKHMVEPSSSGKAPIPSSTKKTCSHKKHSGVKFNFEKYPQIATNYMKNKNIDLSHYDFIEKSNKLDEASIHTTTEFPINVAPTEDSDNSECECCAGNASRLLLQTPSNATELEFNNEDNTYPTSTAAPSTSTATLTPSRSSSKAVVPSSIDCPQDSGKSIKLITLPLSKFEYQHEEQTRVPTKQALVGPQANTSSSKKIQRPGFIPSLFVGITNHYIPDMVLQGTVAPLPSWEGSLKQNLALSAHCATLEQKPTENVAIIANTDKWDVKVVSSQTYVLPCGSGTSGPIGMSQLVSTMLETVNAMWSAGIPAFQCMSFMEAKLQEIYLQSETLAAFLLATEFCSLTTVTSALNLSANDVPLLLSVASVHSPQVTKKYGVSFR